ncbi:MAG: formate--tetrahydrofolate ligase [Leptospirales bacterium]
MSLEALAVSMGVPLSRYHAFGPGRGKIDPRYLPFPSFPEKSQASSPSEPLYVLVTGMTPTPLGEGKTTTSIGLAMALNKLGVRTAVSIRQPSMGPVFGIKGGGAGGGRSTIEPSEVLNLHLTGDIHAVGMAHNLVAAAIDNEIHHGNHLAIDPLSVSWPRVVDLNDRALRKVIVGLGGKTNGLPRESRFDIAVSSEIMAILALARSYDDLSERLSAVSFGFSRAGQLLRASDLGVDGALSAILREAFWPNLMETSEGTPAIVHGSPFANIAHGNSSVIGDWVGLNGSECVVTEAGFGADLGGEKFFDIKCRVLGRGPNVAVLVATAKSLRMHGGLADTVAGKPIPEVLDRSDPDSVRKGMSNLVRQIRNVLRFNVPVVVAINAHPGDSEEEWKIIRDLSREAGAHDAIVAWHFRDGSAGALELAREVLSVARSRTGSFAPLYETDFSPEEKIRKVAMEMYGAGEVVFSQKAKKALDEVARFGAESFAVCIAKTWASLSHDSSRKGAPEGYPFPVEEIRYATGARFITAIAGEIQTMPGLPSRPAFKRIRLNAEGRVEGML